MLESVSCCFADAPSVPFENEWVVFGRGGEGEREKPPLWISVKLCEASLEREGRRGKSGVGGSWSRGGVSKGWVRSSCTHSLSLLARSVCDRVNEVITQGAK